MSIWKKKTTLDELNKTHANSLSSHLEIEFSEIGADYIAATMPTADTTKGPSGFLHGGSACVLAETVANAAAHLCLDNQNKHCLSISCEMHHVLPVHSEFVLGVAKSLRLGNRIQLWEVKNYNARNEVVSVAILTFMVLDKKS